MKKKRKLGRKLLSFLLTLVMVVGLMPGMSLTAYAAGTVTEVSTAAEFKSAINNGGDIKLTGDFDLPLNSNLSIEKAVIIDLNGHKINSCYWLIDAPATIKDSESGGEIINPSIFLVRNGSLTLEGGTLEFTGNGIDVYMGPFTMTGGTIKSNGYSIWREGDNKVSISGGTINGDFEDSNGEIDITGGSFSFDPSALLKEGYSASKVGDYWVVNAADDEGSSGNINVKTRTEEGAPDCGLEVPDDTLDSLLTEKEKERLNKGEAVLFYLDVSPTDPSETDKSLIESKLKEISSDAQVGMFFDMSFYKQVGDSDPEKITDLNGKKVNVLIDVPKELQNAESGKTRIFYVVRIHNGVAEIIAESTNTPIPVESDKFSTYAILYEDVEKSTGSSYEHHHHICERGHIFNYHVFQEPTTETDGYAGWVCDRCGIQDPDHADYVGPTGYIVLSAFPVFNDTLVKNIAAAPENGTVSISTKRWISVRRGVLEALAARPDVTLSISFVYENEDYVLTIKGSDPNLAGFTASGDLFYGFIYLGNGFGLEKKTAEVPQS